MRKFYFFRNEDGDWPGGCEGKRERESFFQKMF